MNKQLSATTRVLGERELTLTEEAAEATAYAEQIREQTDQYVKWNAQVTEGLRRDLAESQAEMVSCDKDRTQLYDKVAQRANEINDLEFNLATAQSRAVVREADGYMQGTMPPHREGLPIQETPTVVDIPGREEHQAMGNPYPRSK